MLFALTLGTNVFAQEKMDKKMHHKISMKKDCVMMKDGKMMTMMMNGKMMAMDKDMTMNNGPVCMMDGNCKMKDDEL